MEKRWKSEPSGARIVLAPACKGRPIVAEQSPWFKGKEVATCLGYGDAPQPLRKNVDEEDKMTYEKLTEGVVCETPPSNQQPHEVYINESGLYCLILRSSKPQAKSFKHWVTSEVLPSIRKHGSYGGGAVAELTKQVKELRTAMTTLTQRLDAQSQIQADRLSSIENNVKHIPEYGPRIEQSRGFPANPDELTRRGPWTPKGALVPLGNRALRARGTSIRNFHRSERPCTAQTRRGGGLAVSA